MKKIKKTALTLAALFAATTALHAETKIATTSTGKGTPKYVFVFVGDGMSYPQIQSAAYYTGKDAAGIVDVVKNSENPGDSLEMKALSFYQFSVAGSASTYDATSFAPDSASTATSIFTGYKTHSSSINVDITWVQFNSALRNHSSSSSLRSFGRQMVLQSLTHLITFLFPCH